MNKTPDETQKEWGSRGRGFNFSFHRFNIQQMPLELICRLSYTRFPVFVLILC